MGTPLDVSFTYSKRPIIGSYLDVGLLVFDGSGLHLLSGFLLNAEERTMFTRKVDFILQPSLPQNVEFSGVITNEIGSRVALVGTRDVFIIEMPNDLWGRLSVCNPTVGDHVLSSYYCRCAVVGSSIQSTFRSNHIVKAQWYIKEFEETGAKVNKIAVLYNSSIIRIFDTAGSLDVPLLKIDFRSIVSGPDYDLSFQNSFGLRNSIVSFDFGPRVEIELEDGAYNTVFAVDSETNVFVVSFRFDNPRVLCTCGPFQALSQNLDTSDFEVCDFSYIRHRASNDVPIFALVSSKGLLCHFVALPTAEVFIDGQISFNILAYDSIQLAEESIFFLKL